ncbi:chemotaxis protein CheW [Pararoseomonas sp. SCSIO 73927]|uniref:chemotaxis protein CheW n=1 Tax=Pararoseomonas sp. SCSIO 73927 TaxID=3114537 RepID=UPI0030CD2BFD
MRASPTSCGWRKAERVAGAEVLTVRAGGEALALPAPLVREVLRPAPLTRIPHAPPALLGLSGLRGAVMPVLSLARLLGKEEGAPSPAARVVVAGGEAPFGLMVEEVSRLGPAGEARAIDLPALLARDFGAARSPAALRPSATPRPAPAAEPEGSSVALLAFTLAGRDHALPLERVLEVARLPVEMTALPRTEEAMLGVVPFRGGLLPLVCPRALLGLRPGPGAGLAGARLVVVRLGHLPVGLVVDSLRAVLHLPPSALAPVPAILSRGMGEARVEAIARTGDGRLVTVLSPDGLFDEATTARLLAGARPEGDVAPELGAAERFLLFRLGGESYGLPVAAVEEVARRPKRLSRLPRAPRFVAGAMTLRGTVLPVIDGPLRFGARAETGLAGLVVVIGAGGMRAGLAVDAVSEVLPIATAEIHPAPALPPGGADAFARVARVGPEGRMLPLVDPHRLLEAAGHDLLAAAAGGGAEAGSGTKAGPAP